RLKFPDCRLAGGDGGGSVSTPQPIEQAAIQQYARQLYLTTVADQFARLAEDAVRKKQSHLSYLEALLGAEVEERERRAVLRRIKRPTSRPSRRLRSSIFKRHRTSPRR